MNLRPKAKRRIAFLAAVTVAVGLIAASVLHLANRSAARRLDKDRAEAMLDYQRGDYARALEKLPHYLEKAKDTDLGNTPQFFKAMLAYGKCRMSVRMNGGENLVEAKTIFQNYLSLCPDDLDAQHALLSLYPQIDYQHEELTLADLVLAKHPDDRPALAAKIQVLLSQPRPAYADALAACDQLNQRWPLDVHGQLLGMEIRLRMHAAPAELLARARSLQKSHEGDPRFELLLASTYLGLSRSPVAGGNPLIASPATAPSTGPATGPSSAPESVVADLADLNSQGRHWLQVAADRPAPDADFVLAFLGTLDLNGMFPQSLALLQKDAPALKDPALNAILVQRLWENGYFPDVVERTASLDPSQPGPDVSSLALRASALYELAGSHGHDATLSGQGAAIVSALAARKIDPAATAWASVLSAHYAAVPVEPRNLVSQYQTALAQDPENAAIYLLIGDAYASLGENEAAASMWESATWKAPEWGLPHARIARLRLTQGRGEEALSQARASILRSPLSTDARATAVLATYAGLQGTSPQGPDADAWSRLLEDVQAIQKQWPGEQETLPLYVRLLARTGRRAEALAALGDAAAVNPPLPVATLVALDEVNAGERLGFRPPLIDRAGGGDVNSILIAVRRASELLSGGDSAAGLASLKASQSAAHGENDPKWRQAVATYLERTGDPDALAAWIDLGDKNPNDRSIQLAVLQSSTRFLDREFWKRSITRLHVITGESGQIWRMERCRWLLEGVENGAVSGEQAEKDRSEAVTVLTDLTRQFPNESEPHRLLGLAFERDHKLDRAADELGSAESMRPADVETSLDLFRVYREANKRSEAQAVLERVARRSDLSEESRRTLALTFEQQDQPERAIDILAAGAAAMPQTRPSNSDVAAIAIRDGILARLYARVGRNNKAEALYSVLLDLPSVTAQELADGAQFFASRGQLERASEFHTRLAALNLPAGAMPAIIGRFQEAFGSQADALASFKQATTDAPASAQVWRELACFHIRHGRLADAAAAVDRGLKAVPADAPLSALAQDVELLRSYKKPVETRLVALALTRDPSDAAAIELLKAMIASQDNDQTLEQKAARFKALSQRYPDFLPAQERLIAAYLEQRQYQNAADSALATTQANPYDADAAQLATGVYLASGMLTRAVDAATAWKKLSGSNTLEPDLAIAEALIALNRPAEAVDCLAPYVKAHPPTVPSTSDASSPSTDMVLYRQYARSLIASGRAADASALLRPLLAVSADARLNWMSLAMAQKSPDAAAAWLDQVAPLIADNLLERTSLAEAWLGVGSALHSTPALHKAHELLAPAAGRNDADTHILALAAQVSQELREYEPAEILWRRLIQAVSAQARADAPSPVRAEIRNNLAYVLMAGGDASKLPEAQQLAEQAVAASPDTSTFYDTLARIYSHQGKRDLAIKNFRIARDKDPNNVEALIGLADELSHGTRQDADAAKGLLSEINGLIEKSPNLSAPLQEQLKGLRERAAIEPNDRE